MIHIETSRPPWNTLGATKCNFFLQRKWFEPHVTFLEKKYWTFFFTILRIFRPTVVKFGPISVSAVLITVRIRPIKQIRVKFWSKIEILVKSRNFGQKSKFWSRVEILVKNQNFGQSRNFGQKSKFWSKIKINRNFGQESKFWSKIKINRNFA